MEKLKISSNFENKRNMMRRYWTKGALYRTTRIIQIFLLMIFSLRSCTVKGQISHHTDYEVGAGRRSGSGIARESSEDDGLSNQSTGMHTNGEILAPKSFPLSAQEPSCEELRAMWIFSKRQSRAAEMSNEIPTYRDPFAYNVWEPMYQPGRGIGSRMLLNYREPSRPVFGRVVNREPIVLQRLPIRTRVFEDMPRMYGSESRSAISSISSGIGPRRHIQYRFGGTSYGANNNKSNQNLVHQGSFQKLKELIWTERAKELTQQRKVEELAARAAALKEISAGQLLNKQLEQNDEPSSKEQNLSPGLDHHYQHNTDSRISIANSQQGLVKSLFSGNPSNSNSPRSGRLLLPNIISADARERVNLQKSFPMRPSHFRERNRVLFRQSTPSDYYQRESRSDFSKSKHDELFKHHSDDHFGIHSPDTKANDDADDIYIQSFYSDIQSADLQQQLMDLNRQLFQLNQIPYPERLTQSKQNHGYNVAVKGAGGTGNRDGKLSNDDTKMFLRSDGN